MSFIMEREIDAGGRWTTAHNRFALATSEESVRLGVPLGRTVVRVMRVRQTQGRNDLVEATVLPMGASPRAAASGVAEERVSIVPAPDWVAEVLDVAASTPLLKLDRIMRTQAGAPIEWRLMFSLSSPSPSASVPHRKLRAQNR